MAAHLLLEQLWFEPERLPEGILRGVLRNPGDAAVPESRLLLTFFDESDRVIARFEVVGPAIEAGKRGEFATRHRLKTLAFFRCLVESRALAGVS